jgi:hypothetical protein
MRWFMSPGLGTVSSRLEGYRSGAAPRVNQLVRDNRCDDFIEVRPWLPAEQAGDRMMS